MEDGFHLADVSEKDKYIRIFFVTLNSRWLSPQGMEPCEVWDPKNKLRSNIDQNITIENRSMIENYNRKLFYYDRK